MKSALVIANCACDELGLPRINSVIDLNDDTARQILALMNRELSELAEMESAYGGWPQLRKEWQLSVTAGVDNYPLPSDFSYLMQRTGWDRSRRLEIDGSLSPMDWQDLKSWAPASNFWPMFRLMEEKIYFSPAPPADTTYYFEYYSNGYARDGATIIRAFAKDTDTPVLADNLIVLGVKWRWLRAKGLDYAEERAIYDAAVQRAMSRAVSPPDVYLDNGSIDAHASRI